MPTHLTITPFIVCVRRLGFAVVAMCFTNAAQSQTAEYYGLGFIDLNNPHSYAYGVSADGALVTGTSYHDGGRGEAFIWTRSDGLIGLRRIESRGAAVAGNGAVIVGDANPPNEGYRWTQGEGFQLLGDLPGNRHDSRAEASSWDGSIIIGSSSSDRSRNREAFIWTPDNGMIGLGGLNENHIYSVAFGVSDDGRKVVGRTHAPDTQVAFLWTQTDGMVNLGVPANWSNTEAHGISPDGSVIVGYGEVTGTGFEAFGGPRARALCRLEFLIKTDLNMIVATMTHPSMGG